MNVRVSPPLPPHQILVVSHYYAGHGGGIERVADKIIQEIGALDSIRFTWAASDTDSFPAHSAAAPLPMWTCNLLEKTIGIPWPIWGRKSLERLKQAVASSSIVWLHDTLYLGNILAYRWAKQFNKPVIITQHIGPIPYKNPLLRWLMAWADKVFTQPMLKGADQAIFISDGVAETYYRNVPFSRPVKIIPNGVDTRVFHMTFVEKRRFLRQQFALKSDQPVLIFVGRFVEKKGLSVIRQLAKLLPAWRFWLVGQGPVNPVKWILPNVHVFQGRKDETLAELYQSADLLILPSYGEGFPLVVQEALACGIPVMCSPQTAAGSFAAKPLLCLCEVDPKDPVRTAYAWANKMTKISLPLSQPHRELSEFAQKNWDWKPLAAAYVDVFDAVAAQAALSRANAS